jgi:tetratricopeptide (TPR) repeat protein
MKSLVIILGLFSIAVNLTAQDSTTYFVNKANEAYANSEFKKTETHLIKALNLSPTNSDVELQLAQLYLKDLRQTKKGLDLVNHILQREPAHQATLEEFISFKMSYKKSAEVLAVIDQLKTPKKLNVNEVRGKCYYFEQQYLAAIKTLTQAVKDNPKSYEANFYLAESYSEAGDPNKAMPYYEQAINCDSSKTDLLYNVAVQYMNNQNYVKAVELLQKAETRGVKMDIDFKQMYGIALVNTGKVAKGKELMDAVIALRPLDVNLYNVAAQQFYYAKQYKLAMDYWDKLIGIDSKKYKALYMIGMCYRKLGDEKTGSQLCDKAIELDPSLQGMRSQLGNGQFGL